MIAPTPLRLSPFALDVAEGLSSVQKKISPRYLYDELGSSLFEAITVLPEYGLTRADERLLRLYAKEITSRIGTVSVVAELGSGSGKKTEHILRAAMTNNPQLTYCPIDVSRAALATCERELSALCKVKSICSDWIDGLTEVARLRTGYNPLLLLFLGSSIGNLERDRIGEFLYSLRSCLRLGDYFVVGADLVKDDDQMVAAYDDPTGVTAAFNRNLLGRINRELEAKFDLRCFRHEARWNSQERRIEMHLVSCCEQTVHVGALDTAFEFQEGEAIWTESSHKFREAELDSFASAGGFRPVATWIDAEWPFANALWQVE